MTEIDTLKKEIDTLNEILNDIDDLSWEKCGVPGCNAFHWTNTEYSVYTNCEMLYPDTPVWEDHTEWFCEAHYNDMCTIELGEDLPEEFWYPK